MFLKKKGNKVGNDHINRLLLCNRLPQSCVPQNNKPLIISLSVGQRLTHGMAGCPWLSHELSSWLGAHLRARVGRRGPLPNSLTGCWPEASVDSSSGFLRVPSQHGSLLLPEQAIQERRGGSPNAFYTLVSSATFIKTGDNCAPFGKEERQRIRDLNLKPTHHL